MGLLSFLTKKKVPEPPREKGWHFSVPREELEKRVQWEESSEPKKEPNSVGFMAISEDGQEHYVTMRTKAYCSPAILDLVIGYAEKYCNKNNYFFMGIQSYSEDGKPSASIGKKMSYGLPPAWLIGYEDYEKLKKTHEENEAREKKFLDAHKKFLESKKCRSQ